MNGAPTFFKTRADAILPKRATEMSAGFDLYAVEDRVVRAGGPFVLVHTGAGVALAPGTYGRIAIRSGVALRESLTISAGVIDADYRGEIGVLVAMVGDGARDVTLKAGERFAQIVVEKIYAGPANYVADGEPTPAAPTARAHAGYGSTGSH
jgi:dUTP pyrophosphatase